MDVLHIGKGWFPEESGGLNRYFYDCMQYLPRAIDQDRGLVAGSAQVVAASQHQVTAFAPAKTSLIKRWQGLRSAFQKLQTEHQYPVISSHFALYTFPILDLIRQPLVVHFHGPWALESQAEGNHPLATFCKQQIEQRVYNRADHFIVLSHAFKQILETQYYIPASKISVVPGGVDLQRFKPTLSMAEARYQLAWPQHRTVILAVRRLAQRMGLEPLIEAIAQLRHQHPDILLLIAGKGAQSTQLQAQIAAHELTDHVRLLGYIEDEKLPVCYQAADFSIVPSQSLEGFGLILLESLASGTPVLGTPIGGIPEVLTPLSTDLLLPSHQQAAIQQGIHEVLDGTRKLPTAKTCRRYVEQNYSWKAIASQLQDIYQSVA